MVGLVLQLFLPKELEARDFLRIERVIFEGPARPLGVVGKGKPIGARCIDR